MYFLTIIIKMLMIQRNQHFPFTERLNKCSEDTNAHAQFKSLWLV